ncbi:ABC transporter ATP-binding protein [Oceanispirochaeta crateris]|uniref:ABC transporter ATP-binding protein n=1 Tax=Oceanispirochaeta crateris TaxID=2518645 RepID=A0A5C1QNH1_9SPIO|nr:ABC transporter ATP-binding protein [Oceanispirochaeta crateris]QEN08104.1 ABC transporter ATP-binding protein [Oceanispirochaeta crateris]
MLSIQNLSFKNRREIFTGLNLTVKRGDFLYLGGPNGAGKTSLLRIIAGLVPSVYPGIVEGTLLYQNEPLKGGGKNLCLTGPWAAARLFCRTVWEEVCFSPSASSERAESLLKYFEIEHLKDRNPQSLSGGEQQLVLICAYLSSDPDLILLDESFAPLSADKGELLADLLLEKHRLGKTILMVEHSLPASLAGYVRSFVLNPEKKRNKGIKFPPMPEGHNGPSSEVSSLLSIQSLVVDLPQGPRFCFEDLFLPPGGLIHLRGPVGSGKSTLIRAITCLQPSRGDLRLGTIDLRSLKRREFCKRISVVLQSPDSQFFCNTVEEELSYSASILKIKDDEYLQFLCDIFELGHTLHQSPFSLSHGEKKKCQLVAALLLKPEVLILDEADAHLDEQGVKILVKVFEKLLDRGTGILFTSHNGDFVEFLKDSSHSVADYCLKGASVEI